jgi:voltage-gated potassium channel
MSEGQGTVSHVAAVQRQRWKLLLQIHDLIEKPMVALGACWLALVIVDLAYGLTPGLSIANSIIWIIFLVDAALEFIIAPSKLGFIRRHWITLLAVALPAVRIVGAFRAFGALRFARSVQLIRLLSSMNRNLRVWRSYMISGRVAAVIAVTTAVVFAGAAGMYSFEKPQALQQAGVSGAPGLRSYPEALWWTAMIITTMGTDYWPKTPEGRVLCFLLAVYAFSVFGYITASLASFFVGRTRQQRA